VNRVPLRAFVVVMATGIVSVGAREQGVPPLSVAMIAIAVAAYVALVAAAGMRVRTDPDGLRAELRSPASAFGALAVVAATEVIASRLALAGLVGAGAAVAACGVVLAAVLLPAAGASALRTARGERVRAATGTWFLATVALESIAVTGADLDRTWGSAPLAVASAVVWVAGLVVYVLVASILVRRLAAREVGERLAAGDHWVAMGALAIASVAASSLAAACRAASLGGTAGALHGAAVVLWVMCSLLVPVLVALEAVLAASAGIPTYRLERWATVFPLGMYSVAGSLAGVHAAGVAAFWVALAAWVAVAAGLLRSA
jgi:Voltage-dependent anion channel